MTQKKNRLSIVTLELQFQNWLEGVKADFKKISWTEKEDLERYVKIAVGSLIVVGFGIYCTDLILQRFVAGILGWH